MLKRVVFMGSPAFAVPSLQALVAAGHTMVAVYTQPPRPAGRGQKEQKTAVHLAAEALGLGALVRHPERLRGEDLQAVMALEADVFAVVAYGLLLPREMVENRVCLNVHPSALPRWRGAAPIQHTVLNGDLETEVCVMRLEAGMDTGPVYDRTPLAVGADMTSGELHDVCARIGAERLAYLVENVHEMTPIAQVGEPTLAVKITSDIRPIDWRKTAAEVHNKVRGLAPAPGATAEVGGEIIKILRSQLFDGKGNPGVISAANAAGVVVGCGAGAVRICEIQRAGKKAMAAAEVARGWPELAVGKAFKVL